jgi:4-amino-4-deoxy-L-arabinose transferase-like glycosyltransferase
VKVNRESKRRRLLGVGFPLLLFLLAFLPRAIQPVSRPLVWYLRSAHFIEDVLSGNLANTVYSEHPGVTLMWPAGIGLKLYWAFSGITPAAHTVPPDFEPIHFFGPVSLAEITAAVAPLALLIALGIVGVCLMLRRLFDQMTAAVAGLLLALSPYYLPQSKILHLEAALATLMLLSALALLVYRRTHHWRWLLFSGALAGLAILTKIPAVFLVPFSGLVLLVDILPRARIGSHSKPCVKSSTFLRLLLPFVIWLIAAALIYVALWPAMWVNPGKGLAAVKWGITRHATTAHDSPTLFLGQVAREDPGPLFYVVSLLFRTGEVELTFLVVAVLVGITSLVRHWSASTESAAQRPQALIDLLLLGVYAVFYLAQMSLGAKKMPRYVLPSLLALDILAAAGVVAWARVLAGEHSRLKLGLLALPVLIQAALILPRHPYYGTALNWLAGGPPAAAEAMLIGEEGEGYAELAAYLNARPGAEELTVAAQLKHVFNQAFRGTTVEMDERPADYLAFHRNYTARDYKIGQWGRAWERYAARTPERQVSFDGVPYAWLYAELPPDVRPEHDQIVHFGDSFRYLGSDLREPTAAPGDRVPVVLYWGATEPVMDDLSIFVHLLDPAGKLIWQDDGAAAHGGRPTSSWAPGEMIIDPHTMVLPSDLPEGDYVLTAGLYDWQTGERLPAATPDGEPRPENRVMIATLAVRRPETPLRVWLARTLGGLVFISALTASLLRGLQNLALNPPSRYN